MIDVLAWTGAALSTLLGLPQAVRALRTNQLQALSAATYWLTLGNAIVWLSWAVATGQPAAGVPALVNGPAAVLVLTRLEQARRVAVRACRAALGLDSAPPPAGQASGTTVAGPPPVADDPSPADPEQTNRRAYTLMSGSSPHRA
jgi:uncharacterized protein with PQ loop repeat